MAKASATNATPGGKTRVRIVVCGGKGTGKSSLIVTAATDSFPANVPPVLPPTRLPEEFYPDRVPITIIDTSSSTEDRGRLSEELRRADAVVLTYACDRPETLEELSELWLPELRQLEVKVPVIVVGCKLDLRDESHQVSLETVMMPIMQQFREIETCIECSALKQIQIPEVFYYAQKAVLHPTGPLFDQETQALKPRCVRALKRIFILCDHDRDGSLSDAELNDFQVKCFNSPLQPSEIVGVKRVVQEKLREGVNDRGLTLAGSVELTNEAVDFLKGIFELFDSDSVCPGLCLGAYLTFNCAANEVSSLFCTINAFIMIWLEINCLPSISLAYKILTISVSCQDNTLRPTEVDDLFSTAPECPWDEAPYKDAAEITALGGLSLDGFLSQWAFMTLLDPASTVENLIYIGYPGDPSSAVRVTRRRRIDRKKQQSERNVFQCFVFGPKNAGKSALLNSFLGRPFNDNRLTTDERYAVHFVNQPGGTRKILVLREIPEDGVGKLLSNKDSLAACDVAVFVHDSSDESSWKKATELLVDVATHGEDTGYEVPCLIVAAKDDLDSFPTAIQDSTRVSQDMGIEAPIPISSKLGDFNNIFRRIVVAAEHPHLSIPETEAGRTRKQYHRLINRSLMFVSVGAAVAIVGLAAYRVYAARKNTSG
ncbi:hypothetical protein Patl1_22648 [Pistacia atlantica]|uniref:Uncharacterized protein n=1 Tax=Pistacia atlantica TaxID=434234 RepID=A0ACC0ZYN6_9ROSI|nr:hypothetical protein Patl1_22648 [Pistacia atlantica]